MGELGGEGAADPKMAGSTIAQILKNPKKMCSILAKAGKEAILGAVDVFLGALLTVNILSGIGLWKEYNGSCVNQVNYRTYGGSTYTYRYGQSGRRLHDGYYDGYYDGYNYGQHARHLDHIPNNAHDAVACGFTCLNSEAVNVVFVVIGLASTSQLISTILGSISQFHAVLDMVLAKLKACLKLKMPLDALTKRFKYLLILAKFGNGVFVLLLGVFLLRAFWDKLQPRDSDCENVKNLRAAFKSLLITWSACAAGQAVLTTRAFRNYYLSRHKTLSCCCMCLCCACCRKPQKVAPEENAPKG